MELAAAALDLVEDPRDVVVAGLGLGFTTQRVLADKRVERVMVVEIEDALIGWMRDGTIPHGPALLADKRVHIVAADIVMAVAEATSTYDLVLLDVDNGPGHLVHGDNARLYEPDFLASTKAAAEPRRGRGGVVRRTRRRSCGRPWSSVFGNCTEQRHGVLLQGREEEYLLYLSRRS